MSLPLRGGGFAVKRIVAQFFGGALLALSATSAVGEPDVLSDDRVFVLYCPQVAEQSARALQFARTAAAVAPQAHFVPVPCGPDASVARTGLAADLWPGGPGPVADAAGLPPDVARLRGGADDWVVLVRANAQVTVARTATPQAVMAALGQSRPTEINDSTWGKIKEIFQ